MFPVNLAAVVLVPVLLSAVSTATVRAEEATIAVASNFSQAMTALSQEFEESTSHRLSVVLGSSGRLYAQISNGAPFDVFLSADAAKPAMLEEKGLAVQDSRSTYAIGRLALWGSRAVAPVGADSLLGDSLGSVAIANPRLAPYGLAASQVLDGLGLLAKPTFKLVQGENIAQTYQFVFTGNADLGFVSLSQLSGPNAKIMGNYWPVPNELHEPIVQDLVILKAGSGNAAAKAFTEFLKSPVATGIIESFGYLTPASEKHGEDDVFER